MKIIFLNVWHNKLERELSSFVQAHCPSTDIFCFQEADKSFAALCPDHAVLRASKPYERGVDFNQELLVSSGLSVVSSASVLKDQDGTGIALYSEIRYQGVSLHLINVHGHSKPPEKLDCPARLLQSEKLIDFLRDKKGAKIMGGDFNILPDQESILMFERNGYRNLIKDFGIATTRNELAWRGYPNKLFHSDYIFTSPEVKIKNFSVPNIEISDHLPLILEFEP